MKLADVSISRPVFATMMIVALVVLGLFSITRLNVDLFPDVDIPVVFIRTILPGAGPEQIETDLTRPIEDAVNSIGGIDHIQSQSLEGVSFVVILFELEVDGPAAAQEVREKVAAIRNDFPLGTEEPIIERWNPDDEAIVILTVSSDSRPEKELTTYTKDVISKRLENVRGVGTIELVGGADREIQVEVDADRLQAYGLSIDDIIRKVGSANYELPGGNLDLGTRQLQVRTLGRYETVEEFSNTVVSAKGDKIVRLKDVADVVDGVEERESIARYNGQNSLNLEVRKQSGANTIEVVDGLLAEIDKLNEEIPSDIKITVVRDDSDFIRHAINDVFFDIAWGGLLAVLVIYFFLANIRSTIITAFALPSSIIATFTLMYAFNFTLNMMSLLGLSLAVGLLIDDAIVVIENIYRHMHEGKSPKDAAHFGTAEIGLAVLAVTFTLVAVFVPVAFMQGIVGRFFLEFGITISVAVLVSLFVAFSLTPMLSSKWLKREDEELTNTGGILNRALYWFNHGFNSLNGFYRRVLAWSLSHRKTIVVGSVLVFTFSLYLFKFVGSEFSPKYDQGRLILNVTASPGTSLDQSDAIAYHVESLIKKRPEVTDILTSVGAGDSPVNEMSFFVKLTDRREREKDVTVIANELRKEMAMIPGVTFSFMTSEGAGGDEKPVAFSITGPELDELKKIADQVETIFHRTPGTVDIESTFESSKPELVVHIDREKAANLGINIQTLASTVRSMIDGYVATKYQEGDDQYDVRVRLKPTDRSTVEDLRSLTIASEHELSDRSHPLIRLGDIATVKEDVGPSKINRYDRQKDIQITANVYERLMGDVIGDISEETEKLDLPPGYSITVVGSGEMQSEAFFNIIMSLVLAVVFVYIILAMQFESFLYPLSIMLSLPMAVIGAVLSLILFNQSISIMSLIGIIMLMGLVTKNAILLIDYTNTLRGRGMKRTEALLQAGPIRLRPILMTTFAMIFGMLPVALALGEGGEFRAPMGITVIGGLVTSTLLTLFIVPVIYSILDDMSWSKMLRPFKKLFGLFNKTKPEIADAK